MGITTISLLFGVSLTRFLTQQAELVNERKIISALPLSQAQPISIHTLPMRAMLHQGSGNFMLIGLRCGHGNPLKDRSEERRVGKESVHRWLCVEQHRVQ